MSETKKKVKNTKVNVPDITSGTVQKISVEDYDKQLNNFKSQNEIMKFGELRAQRQYEKEKISLQSTCARKKKLKIRKYDQIQKSF